MNVLSALLKKRLPALLRAATAGLLLVVGSATAQLLVHAPAQNDVILAGQSTPLSVTVPTSATFSTPDDSYAQVTLEVRVEPLANAGDEARSEFERSGMIVEFARALTAESGVAVRDQDGAAQIVLGDADDGEIRLGSRRGPVLGVASPTPDEDSTFALTVVFSAAPDDGMTAVPTPAEVSAIIAAIRITLPGDSSFENDFLLRVMLSSPGAEDTETVVVVLDAEPQPPEIVITPPTNSTVTENRVLVVASAVGAMSEIDAGDVACSGRRCSTPRAYFANDDGDCAAVPGRTLPTTCRSADTDGDRRPELPALYSRVAWLVVNDERVVLASEDQWFYVAPVIGFDASHKVIPADSPGAISIGLSISAVPEGEVLGNVTVVPMMDDNAVMGASVTFSDRLMSADTVIASPAPGMLTLEFGDPGQDSRNAANYAALTPGDDDNADNYLYTIGNGAVEIVALQEGLIRFESMAPLPFVTSASLTINDLSVTSGTVTYTLTDAEITVNVLNREDASSAANVVFSDDDLTVAFDPGVLRDGDIIEVALALVSTAESPSTLTRSLLFPVALDGIAGDADGNNVPDVHQRGEVGVLPVYNEEGSRSSPIRVGAGLEVKPVLGAYALNVALRREPEPIYSAAFSPESVRDRGEEILPRPPSYNRAGIFDFSVTGLDNPGDVATVLIPLVGEARGGARLSKYGADDDGDFAWNRFFSHEEFPTSASFDRVWSAPKAAGACPVIGASRGDGEQYAWRSAEEGLRSGDACLLLQIQDGGANDADGLINGVIYDPAAITGGRRRSGGGAMDWVWLTFLAFGVLIGRKVRSGMAANR